MSEENEVCQVANDNAPGQVVISGTKSAINRAINISKEKGVRKCITLPVSAPFHCSLMLPAAKKMAEALKEVSFSNFRLPIISNVTAVKTKESNEIKNLLIKQIESPVRWRESVVYMVKNGVTKFIEIGPGKVLSGLIKRIDRNVDIISVNDLEDLKNIKLND